MSWFQELGCAVVTRPDVAPDEPASERTSSADVILIGQLQDAIQRLNPQIPTGSRGKGRTKSCATGNGFVLCNNRTFHKMLRDGVEVEHTRADGSIAGDRVLLVDFAGSVGNDWYALNQFTVIESQHNRRPDVVNFVNGLPPIPCGKRCDAGNGAGQRYHPECEQEEVLFMGEVRVEEKLDPHDFSCDHRG